jgi:hypothetical protein
MASRKPACVVYGSAAGLSKAASMNDAGAGFAALRKYDSCIYNNCIRI